MLSINCFAYDEQNGFDKLVAASPLPPMQMCIRDSLYLSWETAVERASKRYTEILDRWPGPMPYNGKTRWY